MKDTTSTISNYTIKEIIADIGRSDIDSQFHVFRSSETTDRSRFLKKPMRTNHFVILLVTAGEFKIQLNLIDYTIVQKHIFIIPPNLVHQFNSKSDDANLIGVGFTIDFLGQTALDKKHVDAFSFFSSNSKPLLPLNDRDASNLLYIFDLLWEKDHRDKTLPFYTEIINHSFLLLLYELAGIYRRERFDDLMKFTRKEELMMNFVKLLPRHFKEQRSVQFYADQLFITPKHLSKTLKELTNKTCSELIDEMVITEAKILLNDLSLSVANVADELHFSDQFFFSKFFKKHTSLSPSQYKTSNN